MPDLFRFDNYQKCLGEARDENIPAYCVVNSFIKPDQSSSLYNYINDFSKKEKQHFRHDKLQHGICLEECLSLIQELGTAAEAFYVKAFPMDSKLTFDFVNYQFVNDDRAEYNKVLNICINKQLVDNYNLSSFSNIEYCLRSEQHLKAGL